MAPRKTHAYSSPDYQVRRPQALVDRLAQAAVRRRGHRVHAREHLLARPVPDPGREHRGSRGDRPQGRGHRPEAAARPVRQERGRAQGLPRRRPGPRDHPQPHRQGPAPALRHADRGDGARPRRADRLFEPDREPARPQPRQGRALHRLEPAPARQAPDRLCDRRRHPPRRRSSRAWSRS